MTSKEYRLHYSQREDVVFASQHGMKRYLNHEIQIWTPFLEYLRTNFNSELITNQGRSRTRSEELANALQSLLQRLPNQNQFNRATRPHANDLFLPPPSDSLVGQLILGLFESDMPAESLAAYIYFIANDKNGLRFTNSGIDALIQQGKALVLAAPIVRALPYSRVSASQMAGAVRTARNHTKSLGDEVVNAQEINSDHERALKEQLDEQRTQAKRVNDVILRLNRRRANRHKWWAEATEKLVTDKFEEASKKVKLFELKSERAEKARVAEFKRLQDLFESQLRLRAPVSLWENREKRHNVKSQNAMRKFILAGVSTVAFGIFVPIAFGDYIATSFSQIVCTVPTSEAANAAECQRVFSAKGPVTIAGLLLAMSVLMWMARLQYRIHLSERHLALDASEKKAFAETYLALKEGRDVSDDSETIVLASLFRPTQDGIIRDDETGIDLSTVSLMAKQFSRNN
ncbi:DUF6161 domain-containing protein [Roseovarius sp.]|uniref:DUF6161 domain-containing protein n=1 Tax=Roseovarius sp. TaxID=1486281 RepID=UPI0035140A17